MCDEFFLLGASSTAVELKGGCFCWKLKGEPKEPEFEVSGCCCCKRRKVKKTPRSAGAEQVKLFELNNVSLFLKKVGII